MKNLLRDFVILFTLMFLSVGIGSASESCNTNATLCSDHTICFFSISGHEWLRTQYNLHYVKEAQKRGLTCGIVKESTENKRNENFSNDLVYLCTSYSDMTQALFHVSEKGTKGVFNNQVFELTRIVDTLLGPSHDGKTFLKFDSNKIKLEPDLKYTWSWGNCFKLADNIISLFQAEANVKK